MFKKERRNKCIHILLQVQVGEQKTELLNVFQKYNYYAQKILIFDNY
jgi:hypothetical protein